jgi:hypothetical protein
LYALCPLCRLHCHRHRFHVSPEAHFAIWPRPHQLQAWFVPIEKWSRRQQHMNQQGQIGIAEAFRCLFNIKHSYPFTTTADFHSGCACFPTWFWAHSDLLADFSSEPKLR